MRLQLFNPVPIMKLVEVVRTIVTSDEAYETARDFAASLGKRTMSGPPNENHSEQGRIAEVDEYDRCKGFE